MRVQRVWMPDSGAESWTVLGDDHVPVVPVERWLAYLTVIERSPNTIKGYAHDLKDWFGFLQLHRLDWRRVQLEDVGGFLAWLRLPPAVRGGQVLVLPLVESHCIEGSVNRKLSALAGFYQFHARHGVEVGEEDERHRQPPPGQHTDRHTHQSPGPRDDRALLLRRAPSRSCGSVPGGRGLPSCPQSRPAAVGAILRRRPKGGAMVDWYFSEQARHALRTTRTLARERYHRALGPPHLLAAILRQWDDEHAGGPALLRGCGLTAEQAAEHTAMLLHGYDSPEAPAGPTEPRPNPALRFTLAQAFRIAAEAHAPYVGTEHLVIAMLWEDYAGGLRRQGVSYAQAAEQFTALPHTEQASDEEAIEPLEAVAAPTPAAARLAELARQQAEQHPIEGDGRVSTLHHLLALLMHSGASRLLGELGVSYNAVRERIAAQGARLIEADDRRAKERPLEGWERFDITPQQWEVIHPRVKEVLFDQGLWQQGVRFGFNFNQEKTRYWVSIHPGDSGLTHQQVLDHLLGRAS